MILFDQSQHLASQYNVTQPAIFYEEYPYSIISFYEPMLWYQSFGIIVRRYDLCSGCIIRCIFRAVWIATISMPTTMISSSEKVIGIII